MSSTESKPAAAAIAAEKTFDDVLTATVSPAVPTSAGAAPVQAAGAAKHAGRNRKRANGVETTQKVRTTLFAHIKEDQLWVLDGNRGGFAQVPRTLSLFSEVIIKKAVKLKTGVSSAAGTTYNVLWLHTQGHGISKIESEVDAALEAGYGGERGVSTFRKHLRVLKDLGFIDYVEEARGRVKWVLMLNPYLVLKSLLAASLVDKTNYAAMLERASAIGSADELEEAEHDAK